MSYKSITAILPLISLFGAGIAVADSQEGSSGEETRRWLELQRSGVAASTTRQTVSGPVANEIYKRYVESFKHPIPEFYNSDKDGDSGGLSQ